MGIKKVFKRLSIIVLPLVLVGCFKNKSDESTKNGQKESVLNYALGANVKGLDPVSVGDTTSNAVASNIFEKLYTYHYLKRPVQLMPMLAESMPTISADKLTYTIKIKKGVKYQDDEAFPEGKGREVKAKDFAFSIRRLADPRNKSTGWWLFDGKIQGLNDWGKKVEKGEANYSTPIAGLQTPDDHTLVIKLVKPYYQLIYALAMVYTAPMAKEVADKYGEELLNHPVGTGPFKLQSWIRSNKLVLVKNDNWRGETYPTEGEAGDKANGLLDDAGKKLPFVDKIVMNVIVESQPAWLKFLNGDLDISGISKDNFDSTVVNGQLNADMKSKGITLATSPTLSVYYKAFNMEDKLLGANKKLRQALSVASNVAVEIKKFSNGRGIEAQSPIPPGLGGYEDAFKNPNRQFDIEKAKKLLAEAGYPEGKGLSEITYSISSSSDARQRAEQFKTDMAKIGVKIKIDANSWPQLMKKVKEKKVQMYTMGWIADYPDAENFMQLLYGKNQSPGPNGSNFKHDEFDQLYEKAALLEDSPTRNQIYTKMKNIVAEETPWIMGSHGIAFGLKHKWYKNNKSHPIIGSLEAAKYIRIDEKLKGELKPKLR